MTRPRVYLRRRQRGLTDEYLQRVPSPESRKDVGSWKFTKHDYAAVQLTPAQGRTLMARVIDDGKEHEIEMVRMCWRCRTLVELEAIEVVPLKSEARPLCASCRRGKP